GDAAAVVAEVEDRRLEGGLVDARQAGAVMGHGSALSQNRARGRRRGGAWGYFCFQAPPDWYHHPGRALATHCREKTSRICRSHSGWPLATAITRYTALRSRLSSAIAAFTATWSRSGSREA